MRKRIAQFVMAIILAGMFADECGAAPFRA